MSKFFSPLTVMVILIVVIAACTKNYDASPTYSSIEEVFSALRSQPVTVTIDASAGGSFYGNSGTRYVFNPNSFQSASGTSITGPVQVQVNECLQKSDMIFSKRLPVSNGEPLLSGGEINVSASQNGQPIFLKQATTFRANVPVNGTMPPNIGLFMGAPNTDTTQFATNWVPVTPGGNRKNIGIEFTAIDTLGIISDSLKECNADAFMQSPNFQNFYVSIKLSGAKLDPAQMVFGYTLYDDYKGVWPLGFVGSYSNGIFNEKHVPNIPVHFVIFAIVNKKFYGGTLGATPATDSTYTVTLKQTDPTTFKTAVDNL